MSCSVPGCPHPPEHEGLVPSSPHEHLVHLDGRSEARVELCEVHRAEFERLRWLHRPAEESEDG